MECAIYLIKFIPIGVGKTIDNTIDTIDGFKVS